MKTFATSALLAAAFLAGGCADDAGYRNESDRYTAPPRPAASANAQSSTATDGTTQYQDIDIPESQPASAQIPPSGAQPQPQQQQKVITPADVAQRDMFTGNTVQPGGASGIPGTSARNPGNIPPTVSGGGNTAGAAGR